MGVAEHGGTLFPADVAVGAEPTSVLLPGHDVPLGRFLTVRRLLPQRVRRTVGAWCFVDHFGPVEVGAGPAMDIGPHPHTGLQTVTWLADGQITHYDSLGSRQRIGPGQMNLMTSGRGIAHAELSPPPRPPVMHGLQLWVALPESARHGEPRFEHHPDLPVREAGGVRTTVLVGAVGPDRSPARVHTPLVGAELLLAPGARTTVPVQPGYEHGVLSMTGTAAVAGTELAPGTLLYLDRGRAELTLHSSAGARLFLLGGEPFDEPLLMWWNFVGRSHAEIVAARDDWQAGRRFGEVTGGTGDRLPAPAMPTVRLKARDRRGRLVDPPA